MLTPKAYGIAYRSLQTRFNSATKFIKELNLEADAEAAILETLSAQYVVKVKGLHDEDEPKDAPVTGNLRDLIPPPQAKVDKVKFVKEDEV